MARPAGVSGAGAAGAIIIITPLPVHASAERPEPLSPARAAWRRDRGRAPGYNVLMGGTERDRRGAVLEKTRKKTEQPRLFKVLLHNDDYTTMDFVVHVLESIFERSPAEAYRIMMHVHARGGGIAGVYPHEIAETKVAIVHDHAERAGYPLRASLEQE